MARYKQKTYEVEATQWFKNGDHPLDGDPDTEGEMVRYFRDPNLPGDKMCCCGNLFKDHGWRETPDWYPGWGNGRGEQVCPGMWILDRVDRPGVPVGGFSVYPDRVFRASYELVEDEGEPDGA